MKISRKNAVRYGSDTVDAWNYPMPDIELDSSVVYAELLGEHGERTTGKRARIYCVLEGKGKFMVNDKNFEVEPGDVIPVPPKTVYNYWSDDKKIKVLLFMEFLDVSKLPKNMLRS